MYLDLCISPLHTVVKDMWVTVVGEQLVVSCVSSCVADRVGFRVQGSGFSVQWLVFLLFCLRRGGILQDLYTAGHPSHARANTVTDASSSRCAPAKSRVQGLGFRVKDLGFRAQVTESSKALAQEGCHAHGRR